MDAKLVDLLEKFRASNKFTWRVHPDEILKAVNEAVGREDTDFLIAFLYSAPRFSCLSAYSSSPYTIWSQACVSVVLPALSAKINEAVVKAVCAALCQSATAEISKAALSILEHAGVIAAGPLCAVVSSGCNMEGVPINSQTWVEAANLLVNYGQKSAADAIVQGMLRRHILGSYGLEIEMRFVIKSLMVLSPPATEMMLEKLFSHPDIKVRWAAVKAASSYADHRALNGLKSRLGGIFRRAAENDAHLRKKIRKVIAIIRKRSR